MRGALVLVVGPSGAGKDTLIGLARTQLRTDPRYVFPRRVVTRTPSADEENEEMSPEAFDREAKAGGFALSWRAHGLDYGFRAEVPALVAAGHVVVCNVSRRILADARVRFPRVKVVEVTASRAVLAARLAARGRAQDGDLAARLDRTCTVEPDFSIKNEGLPAEGAAALVALLHHAGESAPMRLKPQPA